MHFYIFLTSLCPIQAVTPTLYWPGSPYLCMALAASVSEVLTRGERSPKSQDSVTGLTEEAAEKWTCSWTLCGVTGFTATEKSTANTLSARVQPHVCKQRLALSKHRSDKVNRITSKLCEFSEILQIRFRRRNNLVTLKPKQKSVFQIFYLLYCKFTLFTVTLAKLKLVELWV